MAGHDATRRAACPGLLCSFSAGCTAAFSTYLAIGDGRGTIDIWLVLVAAPPRSTFYQEQQQESDSGGAAGPRALVVREAGKNRTPEVSLLSSVKSVQSMGVLAGLGGFVRTSISGHARSARTSTGRDKSADAAMINNSRRTSRSTSR